jgi:ubiquinone/menaquinone biosynthesis C-methylase UbiE
MTKKLNTSWGKEAEWYEEVVQDNDSYQQKVILPNLLRLMEIKKGEAVLDVGCGTGFFSKAFALAGGKITGVDVGAELLSTAKKHNPNVDFLVQSAEHMPKVATGTFAKAAVVLALQNIEQAGSALAECFRVLQSEGKLYIVLNHPAFRVPQASSWGWDPHPNPLPTGVDIVSGVQYRRIDRYISEKKVKIQMHPGDDPSAHTWSFHRPLQYYFKLFAKAGFVVERLEEWVSHRNTPTGPRKEAENRARAEFPLFLALVLKKAAK